MRILVVSYLFAPYNCIGAVRVSKMAKWLAEMGHDIRVISAADQQFGQLLVPSLPVDIPLENVAYTRWLDHIRFRIRGASLHWQDSSNEHSGNVNTSSQSTKHNPLYKSLRKRFLEVTAFPDEVIGWLPYAVRAMNEHFSGWRPDVIYASGWPVTSLIAGSAISRKSGAPWVAELRDPWSDYYFSRIPRWRRLFDRIVERHTLSSASAIITLTEKHQSEMARAYGKRSEFIGNGYDVEDFPDVVPDFGDRNELHINYFGTIYEQYDLHLLFAAMKIVLSKGLRVRATFYTTSPQMVQDAAERAGVAEQARVLPIVSRKEALGLQMSSDVLLMYMIASEATRAKYTGKLWDYLGSHRPILCIGYDESAGAKLVQKIHAGFSSCDVPAIAAQMEAWLDEKMKKGTISGNSYSGIDCFSREAQARKLEQLLLDVVQPDRQVVGSL